MGCVCCPAGQMRCGTPGIKHEPHLNRASEEEGGD